MAQSAYIIKKRNKKRRLILIPIIILLSVIIVISHFLINVNPILETLTIEETKNAVTILLNDSLKKIMGKDICYDDIVNISKNENGNIDSISVDMVLVNNIARDTTLIVQSELKNMEPMKVSVPIGTLSGIMFFSGLGPNIEIKCLPAGSLNVTFDSGFQAVGINNTMHSINMIVESSVNMIVPGLNRIVPIKTEVPLVDTVIVGQIPEVYLSSGYINNMLNLVP